MSDKSPVDPPLGAELIELYRRRDVEHWSTLERIVADSGISLEEMMVSFPAFARRRELTRLLADYDLFRMVAGFTGSIAEFGVHLGGGLFTWAKLLETFVPGDRSRKVFGFESGDGYQDFSPEDGDPRPWIENSVGRKLVPNGYLERMVKLTNDDNIIAGVERCRVIAGDITQTAPKFVSENQGTRFCLLFLDVNLFKPTLTALRAFYPLLVPGGLVALNGYGSPPWQGEAIAVERYFAEIGKPLPQMRKLSYSIRPGGYFVKD